MLNKVQGNGTIVQYANSGADIVSGQPVLLGDQGLAGIACQAIANGSSGSVEIPCCFVANIALHGHNGSANTAVEIYDKVYLSSGDNFVDVDSTASFYGFALEAQDSGGTTAKKVACFPPIA